MPVIDIHTHFIPQFVVEEAGAGGVFGVRREQDWLAHPEGFRYPIAREFVDVGAKIDEMDRLGIDIAVLSIAPTLFFYEVDASAATAFARRANDALAEMIAPEDRLLGLATLPLQDPAAAADELGRAVADLGLVGAHIGTSYAGRPLDGDELAPVLAAAEQLGVPLMLHPYYVGPKPGLERFYFTNSIGNPLDTCIAAARLIHAGTLDRHERLRIILVHGGGFLPYQLGRLDHAFAVRDEPRAAISRPPSEYLDRFWFDTITHSDRALEFLIELAGARRVVLGTDLPFDMAEPAPVERIRRAGGDPEELGATAAELMGARAGA
jgi:aminocarboxymuconate-semialdehyde decarboxylase